MQCAVKDLISSLELTSVFKIISSIVTALPESEVVKLQNVFGTWPSVCCSSVNGDRAAATGSSCRTARSESAQSKTEAAGTILRMDNNGGGSSVPESKKFMMMLVPSCCDLNQNLCLCHFITTFLLSWPYSMSPIPDPNYSGGEGDAGYVTLKSALKYYCRMDLCKQDVSQFLQDEMFTLRRQLRKLSGYHSSPHGSPVKGSDYCQGDKSCHKDGR
jgi:hypothetical protein